MLRNRRDVPSDRAGLGNYPAADPREDEVNVTLSEQLNARPQRGKKCFKYEQWRTLPPDSHLFTGRPVAHEFILKPPAHSADPFSLLCVRV